MYACPYTHTYTYIKLRIVSLRSSKIHCIHIHIYVRAMAGRPLVIVCTRLAAFAAFACEFYPLLFDDTLFAAARQSRLTRLDKKYTHTHKRQLLNGFEHDKTRHRSRRRRRLLYSHPYTGRLRSHKFRSLYVRKNESRHHGPPSVCVCVCKSRSPMLAEMCVLFWLSVLPFRSAR